MLDPAIQRRVVDVDAALLEHLLQVAVADPILAVLAHRPKDYLTAKMPPFEIAHTGCPIISGATDRIGFGFLQ